MNWVHDDTGRFLKRPHYDPTELDNDCESVVEDVLLKRHGQIAYPIMTEDLFFMLEQFACVDAYADFDAADGEIWGESEFRPGGRPMVRIWRELSENPRFENPLRTTVTHEFSHVRYHGPLFELQRAQTGSMHGSGANWSCKREHVEACGKRDWMEWQAGYCSASLLMPQRALRNLVSEFRKSIGNNGEELTQDSLDEIQLVTEVVKQFSASRQAATVHLRQQGHIVEAG